MNRKYILCRLKKVEGRGMGVNPLHSLYHTPLHIRSTYYFIIYLSTYLRSTLRLRWVTLGDPLTLIFRYLSVPPSPIILHTTVRSSYTHSPITLHISPFHRSVPPGYYLIYIFPYYLPPYSVGYNISLHPL